MRNYCTESAFTLVELMIAMAIVGILLFLGIPSFTSLVASNAAENAANRLLDSLAYTRSEAVTHSRDVTICSKAANRNTCAASGVNNTWVNGWLVYVADAGAVELDGDGAADDLLLRAEDLSSLNLATNGVSNQISVIYDNMGKKINGGPITISFIGGDRDPNKGVNVTVTTQGLASRDNDNGEGGRGARCVLGLC